MKWSLLNYVFSNKWVSTPIIQTNINDVFTISCIFQPSLAWKPGLVDTDTIETKNRISLLVNSPSEVHEFILTKLILIISGSTEFFFFLFCSSYSLGSFLTLQRLPGQTRVSTILQRNIMILYARQKRASLHLKIIQSASCNHQTGTTIEIKTWKGAIQQIIFMPLEDVYSCWGIRFKHLW